MGDDRIDCYLRYHCWVLEIQMTNKIVPSQHSGNYITCQQMIEAYLCLMSL